MLELADRSGLEEGQLLADDKPCPHPSEVDEFFAVCTDDVMHWSRDPHLSQDSMQALDAVWADAGVQNKTDKDVNWQTHGVA